MNFANRVELTTLRAVSEKHGISIKTGRITYDHSGKMFKFTSAIVKETPNA